KNGEYQMQVTFPGPGDYLLLVEAVSAGGERSTYRRSITVAAGLDATSPNKLALRQRNGSPMVLLSAGTRGLQLAKFKKTIEIRNAAGQLVNNWVLAGDENADVSWNGANANGTTLPAGAYEITYILSGENGPIAWLRQPVDLQE
ncbi:MAG: FlgD immunoglobulin-like domain containing protein, partial [Armatimonadota bacterium]